MATILDKDLIRESTVKHNDREIQVTLTADQKISFKLKGMKSGAVSISIDELYNQLAGDAPIHIGEVVDEVIVANKGQVEKPTKDNPMISLNALRSDINTTPMSYDVKILLDSFITNQIKLIKKPFFDRETAVKEHDNASRKAKIRS